MNDPLALLLADGVIDEVCGRLKSGKEADLWLVQHGGHIVAAKIYKARQARSFRNNAAYKEGRQVRDTRTQRAMQRGSRFGQAAAEEAWKAKEADALYTLHAAGVRVPTPVMFYEGVLLMELVVDSGGHPAPRLVDAHIPRERAAALYADLRGQIVRMLGCHLIHGDLSPYNVLVGAKGPVVIDFPQVVGAAHNSQAESFFLRDLENVRRFFATIDPALHAAKLDGREIWRAYVRGELGPEFVPSGNASQPPSPRRAAPVRPQTHHRRSEELRPRSHPPGKTPLTHPKPDRRAPPDRTPPRGATAGAATHARHASGTTRPHGHGRRPSPPSPEVVRVVRPPLGPPAAHTSAPRREVSVTPPAPGATHAPSAHRRRRRRRHL
jgi:RIO kinase 1